MNHQKLIYIHPVPVRIWHWINAVSFIVLIITGIQIRYAETLEFMTLSSAISIHNYVGFAAIANYFIWFAYYLGTGKIKIYIPDLRNVVAMAIKQAQYYGYGFFVGKPNPHVMTPENKFNALQQQAYLVIMMVLLPAQMISGLFLWKVKGYEEYVMLLGGIKIIDTIHVLIFFFFTSFIFIHCYLATLGHTPLAHFKAMFTGYEEHHD
ncbi:cytochrome b/b6 domain-containing protein [Desulfogranum marinum]|uniref:cytochrome b/b6 domain-containing protein n=1 Tax=Desulfogranum marinum TaxID=453220 RepID=UPI0029C65E15|nr:cytochrome b/b6 domain-containing protein [Desulfogranum marinum]